MSPTSRRASARTPRRSAVPISPPAAGSGATGSSATRATPPAVRCSSGSSAPRVDPAPPASGATPPPASTAICSTSSGRRTALPAFANAPRRPDGSSVFPGSLRRLGRPATGQRASWTALGRRGGSSRRVVRSRGRWRRPTCAVAAFRCHTTSRPCASPRCCGCQARGPVVV